MKETKLIVQINKSVKEVKKRRSAGGVVVNPKSEILIVSQNGTSWSLPKGGVENGEDVLAAAKREIYEESGIRDLEFIKKLGIYQRYRIAKDGGDDHSELKTIEMFLFKTKEYELKPLDRQNPEARWLEKKKVVQLLTHEKDKEFFLKVVGEL